MKKRIGIIMLGLVVIIGLVMIFKHNKADKKINIYNTVKQTFLTEKGYSNELSKQVSEDVFKGTNIYNIYDVKNPKYKKPFKVKFDLEEKSQCKKDNNIILVEMVYSVDIADSQGEIVGGSRDVPITFTVKCYNNDWYILSKEEQA